MSEVSSELIFELLKQIQHRLDTIDFKLDEVKSELAAIRGHQLSIQRDINNIYAILGRHDVRFDRIDRRLELNEAPTP